MTIKEQIQKDFIIAMKEKDVISKSALSSIKAKITEAEKVKNTGDLSDPEVIKVLTTAIKQRKQSYDLFIDGNREDLAKPEMLEMLVLEKYMPKQMSSDEIKSEIELILKGMDSGLNPTALIGRTMGTFNKKFTGMADPLVVKSIIEELV